MHLHRCIRPHYIRADSYIYIYCHPFNLVIIFPSLRRSLLVHSHEKRDESAEGRPFWTRIGPLLRKKAKWKVHRNAGIYGFNISSSHFSFSLFLLREEKQITRRRRWMIFISLNSFHGRLASNARIGGKRRGFLRLWELRAHPYIYALPMHSVRE